MEGVDYAWARPNLQALKDGGIKFVCRYLANLPNGKVIDRQELDRLHKIGFGVVFNWEQGAGDMLRGYSVGVQHGRSALQLADSLGVPATRPIYFSCDTDLSSDENFTAVRRYLDGVNQTIPLRRIGIYGEYDVIEQFVPSFATWGWQTYAWSNKKISEKTDIYQYDNDATVNGQTGVDRNRSMSGDFGAWFPGGDMASSYGSVGDPGHFVEGRNELVMVADLWGQLVKGGSPWTGGDPLSWITEIHELKKMMAEFLARGPVPPTPLSSDDVVRLAQELARTTDAEVIESTLRTVLSGAKLSFPE